MKWLRNLFIIFHMSAASAALIDHDVYTHDTRTTLDWLDLTETQTYTVKDLSILLRPTYDHELGFIPHSFNGGGWRFASREEVINLFVQNIGTSLGIHSLDTTAGQNAQYLLNLLEPTFIYFSDRTTAGYIYDGVVNIAMLTEETLGSSLGYPYVESIYRDKEYDWHMPSTNSVGTFLVRDHISIVPIPASLPLFLTGIFLLNYRASKHLYNCSYLHVITLTRKLTATAQNTSRYFYR